MLDMEDVVSEEVVSGYSQKQLGILVEQTIRRSLLSEDVSTCDKARLLSVGLPPRW